VTLGAKLGEGAGSEVYAWGADEALKLFTAGTPRAVVEHEARATRLAHEAGAPAPDVRGVVELHGRYGIIFPRIDGEPLLTLAVRGDVTPASVGETMAKLQHELHRAHYRTSLPTFRAWVLASLPGLERRGVPPAVLATVKRRVFELPEDGVLCHGDMHPGNILMTREGPRIIDWISALSAPALVDVAREHLTLTMLDVDEPLRAPMADADAAFIETYAALSGTTSGALLAAVRPYLPVMAAMRMLESHSTEAERRRLVAYIRAAAG
jgi:Ser/Thr protein kinase RdoA (MazF antagonist)